MMNPVSGQGVVVTNGTIPPQFIAPMLSNQAQHAISTRGTAATLNLDDIFEDCFFTPEGDTVFLSEQTDINTARSGEGNGNNTNVNTDALRPGMISTINSTNSSNLDVNTSTSNPVHVNIAGTGQGLVPRSINSFNPSPTNMSMNYSNMQLSGETVVTNVASRPVPVPAPGPAIIPSNPSAMNINPPQASVPALPISVTTQFMPVPFGGGISTTGLQNSQNRATVMGMVMGPGSTPVNTLAPVQPHKYIPMAHPPHQRHHLQYITTSCPSTTPNPTAGIPLPSTDAKRSAISQGGPNPNLSRERKMSETQKNERRYVPLYYLYHKINEFHLNFLVILMLSFTLHFASF